MPVMHTMGSPECGLSRSALQTLSRSHCKNIKQKISQWEVRSSSSCGDLLSDKPEISTNDHIVHKRTAEDRRSGLSLSRNKQLGLDFREAERGNIFDHENHKYSDISEEEIASSPTSFNENEDRIEFLETEFSIPPGNFYTSPGMFKKSAVISQEDLTEMVLDFKRKRGKSISTERELDLKGLTRDNSGMKSLENIYYDPTEFNVLPSINPVPKPRRTFRYSTDHRPEEYKDNNHRRRRSIDESDTESSDPSAPPPEPSNLGNRKLRPRSKRKSFEFEDIQTYRRFIQQTNHPEISEEPCEHSRSALYHTMSEDNIYEDITYPPKENPYEDIKISPLPIWRAPSTWKIPPPRCTIKAPKISSKPNFLKRQTLEFKSTKLYLHKKTPKDSTLPVTLMEWKVFRSAGDTTGKKKKKFPKLVMKIQDIFDAKRGKKKVKVQPFTNQDTTSSKGEASETESEAEDRQKKHNKRLAQVQSSLKRNPHYQTLERDLIEFQEQQLFELFVVVSLQKKPSGDGYVPHITQQYPNKNDQPLKQSKDTEERLKVIPKFCFPDSKDWAPTSNLKSETFSFVLTGEDGSRWFGYCKKLLPQGKGKRLPEVYCMVSRLGCFNLFSKILDEVEKRREMSPALVSPFMRSVMDAPFPAPGRTITVKSFLPGSGNEVIELCRPMDSRLEHVDFECLFKCLSVSRVLKVFASLLLERRVIFVADSLSTLSKCAHAVVAMLYPFTWQHTYIPVLPASMIDIVCSPTPFLIGILSCSFPLLSDLPIEEVLIVDLCGDKFLKQVSDEDEILPHKLQAALVQILEQRNDIMCHEHHFMEEEVSLNSLVSESFVWFFVEIVGHYSLHMYVNEKGQRVFQREPFRKSHTSRSVRQFLDLFMETQMFAGFTQDRELRKSGVKGLFEVRACEYLKTLPETEPSGVNKFLRGLGSKMKFLQKK
ncbi:DENN domain-containing protein 2C [Bombina bombina]|uniref:DENN domain-containing protein 2C n=1 Tax=Bombina bombina TaxID=8345 RepID=UPI00235A97B9|nr:DENN domain-containing protein 2C [Bombina bombina]